MFFKNFVSFSITKPAIVGISAGFGIEICHIKGALSGHAKISASFGIKNKDICKIK